MGRMNGNRRKLAVVTGACSGVGLELARLCAQRGFDLVVVAAEPMIFDVALDLGPSVTCTPVRCDLATVGGIASLMAVIASAERAVDFLFADAVRTLHTNIDGTVRLVFAVAGGMRSRGSGRILITGSLAGLMPESQQAVHDGSKTFLDSFAAALGNELKDTGVTVMSLIPGATQTGISEELAAAVARIGFERMMEANPEMVAEVANELLAAPFEIRARP